MSARLRYLVRVLGPVGLDADGELVALSPAKSRSLALLVAAGRRGVGVDEAGDGATTESLRMAMSRLREHLPAGALPPAVGGRYRLVVPPHQVDAWTLLSVADGAEVPGLAELRHLLGADEPFAQLDGELLDRSRFELRAAQRALIERLSGERPDLMGLLVEQIRAHLDESPYDEGLIRLLARLLASSGRRRGAVELIAGARARFAESGLTLDSRLDELELVLHTPIEPRSHPVPHRLRRQLDAPLIGRSALVAVGDEVLGLGDGPGGLVVRGPSGSGKTRLLAELGLRASEAGWRVVHVAPLPTGSPSPFAALFAALPEVKAPDDDDPASRHARSWDLISSALRGHEDRVCLLVDDAQWLDPGSVGLIAELMASGAAGRLVPIVGGRSDAASGASWDALIAAARHGGLPLAELEPLSVTEIRELVAASRPELAPSAVIKVADRVHQASAGWPGVAAILLRLADPRSGRLPEVSVLSSEARVVASPAGLSPQALLVGALTAVLGGELDLDLAAQVSGRSIEQLLDGVDELVRRQLVLERSPLRFVSAHALVDAAFVEAVPRRERVRWHARAAELIDEVHRRARHLRAAVALVGSESAIAAQLGSAEALLAEGMIAGAVAAFDAAAELADGELPLSAMRGWSRAHDLAGNHLTATEIREAGLARAGQVGQGDLALELVVSGLPEAEMLDGSAELVDQLRRVGAIVPAGRLSEYQAQLARQLAVIGELAEAETWAEEAHRSALDPADRMRAALVTRFAISATSDPRQRLVVLDKVADILDQVGTAARADYWVCRLIDLYEAGERDGAELAHAELESLPGLPALRRWHALLYRAMRAADRDRLEEAAAIRVQALELASRAGLRSADEAHLGATFVDHYAADDLEALVPLLAQVDSSTSLATAAGLALVSAAAGDLDQARRRARSVVTRVVRSPVAQGLPALAVSAVLLEPGSELARRADELLATRGDSLLVAGAAAASLGPVCRYRAALQTDGGEARRLLQRALETSQRAGALRWERICRRELDRGR